MRSKGKQAGHGGAHGRQRQWICEFKSSLVDRVSSRTASAVLHRETLSRKVFKIKKIINEF